jgi:ferredoxin
MNQEIKALYFSATGTTKKIVIGIADQLAKELSCNRTETIDFTLPAIRKQPLSFTKQDIVVVGIPVYAGRVPNVLVKYLNTIQGNGALAIAAAVYGNRNYDDALIELRDILVTDGFHVIAGGAFIGEHSFSKTLAADRPDEQDMAMVQKFARQIHQKLTEQEKWETVFVRGNQPYRPYYQPKDKEGKPASIQKVIPKTSHDCTNCKLCVSLCPMGSIDADDVSKINGICIKCCACIKKCPVGAKYFDDTAYLRHKQELEDAYTVPRREPEFFL